MFLSNKETSAISYYNTQDPKAKRRFSRLLLSHFQESFFAGQPLVFLCIGSDRATGDALGPLIGQNIEQFKKKKRAYAHTLFVYGSLSKPVHAMNLMETVDCIYEKHTHPYIIAIDASLGIEKHIGYVTLGHGPLTPGIGVGKHLPAIGDAHITGIVNTGNGTDLNQILQTTHLSTVVTLSNFVSEGIITILQETESQIHSALQSSV